MVCVEGKSVFGGIAVGPVWEPGKKNRSIRRRTAENPAREQKRFEQAAETAQEELAALCDKALAQVGEEQAAIFEVHQMMLADDDYLEYIDSLIAGEQAVAEFAVEEAGRHFAEMFASMDDDYMKARAADVRDISERLIRILCGEHEEYGLAVPSVILADDLAPSETIQLDRKKILAFVLREGSVNSHTAILARTMNIPALVCTPVEYGMSGKTAIVDGGEGKFILEPDDNTLRDYEKRQEEEANRRSMLLALKGKKTATKSGKPIRLYANIGGVADAEAAAENDAEGIGLFRSEFLYLQNDHYPTEEEQYEAYRRVAEIMAGKKVIIRTLDIGADKRIDYFGLAEEENPAMGYRAIRICLDRPEVFKTQLRAICRAAAWGDIAVMVPMITSLWEVRKVREILGEVTEELKTQGLPAGTVELGIMIETPAAVMIADELAAEVDFFSIGTNDLTQYTLAVDRQNEKLDMFYDAHHPAVLKMIQMVIDSAHAAGIWAGICGELGADTELTGRFLAMGIDELSVSPAMILPLRKCICDTE